MLNNSWCFYEERLPRKRIFFQRKRSVVGPLLTVMAAIAILFETVSRL